jgi:hypothetical protein
MGMSMGVNPYPPVYMGDPVKLFLYRGYGYGVVIPGGYLLIAISTRRPPRLCSQNNPDAASPTCGPSKSSMYQIRPYARAAVPQPPLDR